jgi:hypothetical protein
MREAEHIIEGPARGPIVLVRSDRRGVAGQHRLSRLLEDRSDTTQLGNGLEGVSMPIIRQEAMQTVTAPNPVHSVSTSWPMIFGASVR